MTCRFKFDFKGASAAKGLYFAFSSQDIGLTRIFCHRAIKGGRVAEVVDCKEICRTIGKEFKRAVSPLFSSY
ncbi:hypothetical protein CAMRE0001_0477 [Campylobacter rectus RM3267]|uniref:Uncharacterized protein n=2 Tax=Campylobacter rectus TaxID=203 RepID=A0A6G5QM88_CAMRE|nr:hypothetical protein CAMRE0001_0477 [Campylobacter rectus RM3267]QCD46825.1 hypothetical protein CRECT_1166 [Campylobacter rectus]